VRWRGGRLGDSPQFLLENCESRFASRIIERSPPTMIKSNVSFGEPILGYLMYLRLKNGGTLLEEQS
jgi:hypothetical protein